MRTVAALYVQRGGCYWDLAGCEPWDAERAARLKAEHEAEVLRRVLTVSERGEEGPDVELAQECAILTGALMRRDEELETERATRLKAEERARVAEGHLAAVVPIAQEGLQVWYAEWVHNDATEASWQKAYDTVEAAEAALRPPQDAPAAILAEEPQGRGGE